MITLPYNLYTPMQNGDLRAPRGLGRLLVFADEIAFLLYLVLKGG